MRFWWGSKQAAVIDSADTRRSSVACTYNCACVCVLGNTYLYHHTPITAAVMGENITTDTPRSTQCLGDRLTDCLKHQGRHVSTQGTRDEDKTPKVLISAILTCTGYFAHFLYQKLGCLKYTKYHSSKCNLVLFMEVREMDNTACNTLLVTFYSGHGETSWHV